MNNKVNYTFIGVLVLVGLAMIVVFSYWLLQPSEEQKIKKYYVYFKESVLGLNLEAPVKYRGVNVGKVTDIKISPDNTEEIQVVVSILESTPIKTTTLAQLTSQGITGLSYINLSMGDNDSKLLEKERGQKYPVIKTVPSFFEKIEQSFGDLLSDENQKQIGIILNRTAKFMDKLDRLVNDKTINSFHSSVENLDSVSNKLNMMMPQIEKFVVNSVEWENKISANFQAIMESYMGIRDSMDHFKASLARGDFNIKDITSEIIPTLNSTISEVQHLVIRLDALVEQYEKSPGDILYKTQEIKKGPGE